MSNRMIRVADSYRPLRDIDAFHEKYGFSQLLKPGLLPDDQAAVRLNFLLEELLETADSMGFAIIDKDTGDEVFTPQFIRDHRGTKQNLYDAFDGLIDLAYVLYGTAWFMNLPFAEGWARVQQANMKKMRAERVSQSTRGTTFDVVKPIGWTPPILSDLLE